MADTRIFKLPPKFHDDHVRRDLPGGTVVRATKTHVYVELDHPEWVSLMDDAIYYRDNMDSDAGFTGPDAFALLSSARATVKALAAGPVKHVPKARAGEITIGMRYVDPFHGPCRVTSARPGCYVGFVVEATGQKASITPEKIRTYEQLETIEGSRDPDCVICTTLPYGACDFHRTGGEHV